MTRLQANRDLVATLATLIEQHPDMRFGQLLRNFMFIRETRPVNPTRGLDWENEFYLESQTLLARVLRTLEGTEKQDDPA